MLRDWDREKTADLEDLAVDPTELVGSSTVRTRAATKMRVSQTRPQS
jgi:hypothetical protein